jgi:hypothetical protein
MDMFEAIQKKNIPFLKKGDFVITDMGFPAIVLDNMTKSKTRMIHAFGMAEETGSAYTAELKKISEPEFERLKTDMFKRFGDAGQWSLAETERQRNKLKKVI